jgi:hypothetical protein
MPAAQTLSVNNTKLQIFPTKQTAKTITGISKANPAVVTSTAHGYATNDLVWIDAVVGMTELNKGWYVVGVVAANTFELRGVDSTGFATYTSAGSAQRGTPVTWCETTGYDFASASATKIDVTSICSKQKDYVLGLPGEGSFSAKFFYHPGTVVQSYLEAAKNSNEVVPIQLVYPTTTASGRIMMGQIESLNVTAEVDGVFQADLQMVLTQPYLNI